ncbi:MAG TPA: carboxypeptidase-like regulatory domain-containing protein [Planctomycetota bacterium]
MNALLLAVLTALPGSIPIQREPAASRPSPGSCAGDATATSEVTLAGRCLDELGAPLAGWTVGAEDQPTNLGRSERFRTATDGSGRFAFTQDLGRSFALVLRSPDGLVVALREDFVLDGSELVLQLRAEDRPTSFLAGELSGPLGEELANGRLSFRRNGLASIQAELRGGRFRVGPLAPGEYSLSASADGYPWLSDECSVEAYTTLDIGALRLAPPGWIRVRIAHPGVELGERDLVLTHVLACGRSWRAGIRNGPMAETPLTGGCAFASQELPPRGLSRPLAAGRYLLRTQDRRWAAPDVWVDVSPGRIAELEITLVPATVRTLVLRLPDGDPSIRAWLGVTSADGEYRYERWNTHRGKSGFGFDVDGLLQGTYSLEARSGSGRTLVGSFEVFAVEPARSEPIRLDF